MEWVAIHFSRDLPDSGIEPSSPTLQADSLLSEEPRKPNVLNIYIYTHNTHIYMYNVLFIIGDWNAKVGSREIPDVTSKFDLEVQN